MISKLKKIFKLSLLAASLAAASASSALTINLNDVGGVAGTPAELGFRRAADYWQSVFTNNATVNIDVGYSALPPGVLGGTQSTLYDVPIWLYGLGLSLSASNSFVDNMALTNFPALDANGALSVITPGYVDAINKLGIDNSKRVFDNDGSYNNTNIAVSAANLKALGFGLPSGPDANIQFSNVFPFDFEPTDGIDPGSYDFVAVAIHEIGHALGFISGADDYDFLGRPNGPAPLDNYPVNDTWWGYALDLFRYSDNPDGFDGGGPKLDWAPGSNAYFSIDGGATAYLGGNFATGTFNGDGDQASHWKAPGTCTNFLGVMNPYICNGHTDAITALDLSAFDAIGWNLREDLQGNVDYRADTRNLAPEPTGMALVALALVAAGLSRRRATQAQ